mgnify:CR=1 FL=1
MGLSHRSIRAALAAALAVFLAWGCAAKPHDRGAPLAQQAFLSPDGREMTGQAFAALARKADYVLLGEAHANACDHAAQARAIAVMVQAGVLPAIGLEMIPAPDQALLAAVNDPAVPLEALPERLNWSQNWGYDFSMYAPIFELARKYGLPVYALNADRALVKTVSAKGLDNLPPASRAALPGEIIPPPPAQEAFLREQFAEHMKMRAPKAGKDAPKSGQGKDASAPASPAMPGASDERMASFFTIQALWDTQMAQRALLAHARSGRPVAVIAGSGHVESGWGLAHRLKRLDPEARVLSVMPWRGGDAPSPGEAGAFYYCPISMKTRLGFTLEIDASKDGAQTALLVTFVEDGSKAQKAGILPGDAITQAGGKPAASPLDLHKAAIEAQKSGAPLSLTIRRAEENIPILIELAKPSGDMK